ncbi:hypothetical protein C1H46_015106 [Malus baccata]|uniref:Uncharacterized protein n=1 Tax=Malus baccata TaxID=106549 RepID=A0A540MKK4_MALBA|nr:hypothetical protein C1H46_015106 [Malus baccata]
MEATLLSSQRFHPKLSPEKSRGAVSGSEIQICCLPHVRNSYVSLRTNPRNFMLPNSPLLSRLNRRVSVKFSNRFVNDYTNVEATPPESLNVEVNPLSGSDGTEISKQNAVENAKAEQAGSMTFRNRFLNFVRLSSVVNNAAESFFKSEIRRRLFVTAVLIVISRVGYFIPLPGFDRRLIPQDYLSFVSGSVDELGDFAAELKMSFFQLGISPQIIASIIMQVLCHVIPSLVKLRKEGLDGQGSSLIICVQILIGYTETLYKMLSQLSGSSVSWGPYLFAVLGVFTIVTMWAVVVTEGCRKIKLQYYGFKLASAARDDSPITEVEPYIPFTINPSGMQPVLTTTYLLAFPGILASILGSPFWEHVKEILNPETTIGAGPWANLPKEIADYLNKMGARIPNIKPGKATIEYLTKIQASTRFWGGLLLSILATTSSIIDHYLRNINAGFAIGLTSVLIIVGSIIELRRSYQAYNVMPSLSKALSRYGA